MFYSQTYLARKGPLGTVWCAAHMQNRLKKSHYTSTDILATVDRIMFPEVPLALRMSSHLLLGVVRIYSKQVDILYDDCNSFVTRLRKAFASIDLNLPEDVRQAPVQAITLPDTFDLDAMDLDVDLNLDKVDNHLKCVEDITLDDQIPVGTEPYISISFDDDFMESTHTADVPDSSLADMDRNAVPQVTAQNNAGVSSPNVQNDEQGTVQFDISESDHFNGVSRDPGPSSPLRTGGLSHSNGNSFDTIPEIEVMREAVPDISVNLPHSPNFGNDIANTQSSLEKLINEKEVISPIIENNLSPREQTRPFQPSSEPQVSGASLQEDLVNKSTVSFAIRATPPVQQPKAIRRRKRKQAYDEAPVLTNKFMKKSLEDPSDLLRKRNKVPYSALAIWKLENCLRKEKIFSEPSITGLGLDLRDAFNNDCMCVKLVSSEDTHPDSEVMRSPVPETRAPLTEASPHCAEPEFQTPRHDNAERIEILRHAVSDDEGNTFPEIIPSLATPLHRTDGVSPSTSHTMRSTPVLMTENDTSTVFSGEHTGLEYTALSDIPELNFDEVDNELFFLEVDNTPTAASTGLHGVDSLSVRARAVAQYLKRQSPITPSTDDESEHLTLNKILKGKTRKICARMFFETLVLKSNGLVDMEQEVPYGNITLKLTAALSKAQI